MEKQEFEALKVKVPCDAVLEHAGFALDIKESTRRAMKYRRDAAIIIVIHEGMGWFDPLSDAKGDVVNLVERLQGVRFVEAMKAIAGLVGFVPTEPQWERKPRSREPDLSVPERWRCRHQPWRGSASWWYLYDQRCLPECIIRTAISTNMLREGPHGSMWAAHTDTDGAITGWEERGPAWRGFASGGTKVLFRLGSSDALRICVTEAAIDAMSVAAIENLRPDTLYLSTGGGWSPATAAALRALARRPGTLLVAATDSNAQGEIYADRLAGLATQAGHEFTRLCPAAEDWNDTLKARAKEERGEKQGRDEACRTPAICLKGEASPG